MSMSASSASYATVKPSSSRRSRTVAANALKRILISSSVATVALLCVSASSVADGVDAVAPLLHDGPSTHALRRTCGRRSAGLGLLLNRFAEALNFGEEGSPMLVGPALVIATPLVIGLLAGWDTDGFRMRHFFLGLGLGTLIVAGALGILTFAQGRLTVLLLLALAAVVCALLARGRAGIGCRPQTRF
jgi:hypothetical protein